MLVGFGEFSLINWKRSNFQDEKIVYALVD